MSLSHNSLSLRNTTLGETRLDTKRDRSRNSALELINIGTIDTLPKSSLDDLLAQRQDLLDNLSGAEVLAVEARHEGSRLAIRVELRMHAALVEGRHLVRGHRVRDQPPPPVLQHAVLRHHLDDEPPGRDDLQLRRARVQVRRVEAAGVEEADGHAGAGADERGERLAVRGEEVAAFAGEAARLVEVEQEILVLGEDREAVARGVGEGELRGEAKGGGGVAGLDGSGGGEGGGGQDGKGNGGGEMHFDGVGDCVVRSD